ncbi:MULTISPECIES: tyrosine-protein phosphatase [Kitasatospora]|uniref:Tyrosine-protein phosphatase n=1 Tax=Kitasatospora cathayae TaxID=3004092 RepID=A0ABY7QEP6_9ACTN|nr:tyrosine-protein phosphatase [Kitasatospora sp. HUAS 3-15]WBP91193.1 tyrosine-protein phosphatase [Kitasatospora sp. HUAS 3-15]
MTDQTGRTAPVWPADTSGDADRAWRVLPGIFAAGVRADAWDLPDRPTEVVCLSRTVPKVYDRSTRKIVRVHHRPFTYWESADPAGLLGELVEEIRDLAPGRQLILHCTLGLDRTGVVALALLVRQGLTVDQAVAAYRTRRVRLPALDALDVFLSYASRQALEASAGDVRQGAASCG